MPYKKSNFTRHIKKQEKVTQNQRKNSQQKHTEMMWTLKLTEKL